MNPIELCWVLKPIQMLIILDSMIESPFLFLVTVKKNGYKSRDIYKKKINK